MLSQHDIMQLLNQASVKLSGATIAGIKAELFDTLTEFFDVSSSWLEHFPIDAAAYQREYSVAPGTEGQIIRLAGVIGNTNFATNAAYEAAKAQGGSTNLGSWLPQAAVMPHVNDIILRDPPSNPQAMRAVLIKNVKLPTATGMIPQAPQWVLERYHNYILDGILGRMMGSQNKSYTNDALSTYHLKRFQEGISRARVAALKENTYGAQAWAFPQQWKTRSQNGYLSVGNDTRF